MLCIHRNLTHTKRTNVTEEGGSHKHPQATETVYMDVTQANQFTLEYIDGDFVFVSKNSTTTTTTTTTTTADNTNVITSASTVL